MVIFTLVGLLFNIKTVSLNSEMQRLSSEIRDLKAKNQSLHYHILSQTSLSNIDKIATEQLNMTQPDVIRYFSNQAGNDERK